MTLIQSAKQARAAIGKQVWWDDHSTRYVMLRTGIVDEVDGGNICIEGNWLWRNDLKSLRDTAIGGAFTEKDLGTLE
ncbi:MAG: hypothetical protein ACNJA3_29090 (plasmid) [Pseudomonas rhizophila]|uniref:hypothetical protein n=1 Tax=Pseudomonas rhizophila TaxID=2045200 RepID=UPI003F6B9CBA